MLGKVLEFDQKIYKKLQTDRRQSTIGSPKITFFFHEKKFQTLPYGLVMNKKQCRIPGKNRRIIFQKYNQEDLSE